MHSYSPGAIGSLSSRATAPADKRSDIAFHPVKDLRAAEIGISSVIILELLALCRKNRHCARHPKKILLLLYCNFSAAPAQKQLRMPAVRAGDAAVRYAFVTGKRFIPNFIEMRNDGRIAQLLRMNLIFRKILRFRLLLCFEKPFGQNPLPGAALVSETIRKSVPAISGKMDFSSSHPEYSADSAPS